MILIVEDEAILRFDAIEFFEEEGFDVIEAETADAGLLMLQTHSANVRLLFTDIQTPGEMDGMALAHHAHHYWPHVRLILTSGQVKPQPREMPPRARFIPKPYVHIEVLAHARELLA